MSGSEGRESYGLGVDLGGSSVKAVAVKPDGGLLMDRHIHFSSGRHLDWAEKIRGAVLEAEERFGPALRMGLSAPGLPSRDDSTIAHMPGRLEGLEDFDWGHYLGLGKRVPVMNDAQAALLGEAWLGAARGCANVFMLTLGTGVGGAAMVDGHLLKGHLGRAGHLGHISLDVDGTPDVCGTPGSLELAIGNCTMAERSAGRYATTHELIRAYQAGDEIAQQVWLRSVRALACGIASLINVLDPELVLIGGGIAQAEEALFGPLQKALDEVEWRPGGVRVGLKRAELGEFAGAYGAARKALERV